MRYRGGCRCNKWRVEIEISKPLIVLNPRVCDCCFCQNYPSSILSDSTMCITLIGSASLIKKNGDQLANFYYCAHCNELLAVGCELGGQLRGAVNAQLLNDFSKLGEPIQIQPRLLSPEEKLDRWSTLWGTLKGV